ncbi:MAG: efflux RND transporter periplasmic adaptor subunit [Gemmatimonadota bacterium]
MTRRSWLALAVAVLVVTALAAGVVLRLGAVDGASENAASEAGETVEAGGAARASDVPIPVEGAEAVLDTLVLAVKANGRAFPERSTTLLAQVGGQVARVPVGESDRVGGGRVLLSLDPTEYQLAVDDAEAQVRRAEAEYRSITLFDDRIEDTAVREERGRVARARSGLDQAEIALRRAELDLSRTRVTSPFGGRVADVQVVAGEWVRAGDPLLTVSDLDPIRVEAQVLETEVGYLQPGGDAAVSFAAWPDEPFRGTIRTINPLVEGESRVVRVTVEVPNPDGRILPGMFAEVSLDARRFPDRVLIPREAVVERDRRSVVFVYEGDRSSGLAKWRYVTPGLENDLVVEILDDPETDGVSPGDVVLTGGHYTLIHDARVRLVEDAARSGGRPD